MAELGFYILSLRISLSVPTKSIGSLFGILVVIWLEVGSDNSVL